MTSQKLVDELEKALTDEAYDGGMGAMSPEEFRELVRTLAVTAAKAVDELRASPTLEQRHASHGHAGSYCMPAPPFVAGFGVGAEFSAEVNHLEDGHDDRPSQREPALGGTRVEGRQGEKEVEEGLDEVSAGEEAMSEHAPSMRVTSEGSLLVRLANALEAAEKAHTPTDDEPEALRIAELDARQAAYRKEREDWFVDHEAEPEIATNAFFRGWDAAVGGGFRRSEVVPEPSTECPQPCVHLSQHDAREGRTCAEHPCTCPEPQGEPSDASVDAARSEIAAHMNYKTQPTRGAMRAALRAAGVVGQEGEQR